MKKNLQVEVCMKEAYLKKRKEELLNAIDSEKRLFEGLYQCKKNGGESIAEGSELSADRADRVGNRFSRGESDIPNGATDNA